MCTDAQRVTYAKMVNGELVCREGYECRRYHKECEKDCPANFTRPCMERSEQNDKEVF